jgi:hypothetical protein
MGKSLNIPSGHEGKKEEENNGIEMECGGGMSREFVVSS